MTTALTLWTMTYEEMGQEYHRLYEDIFTEPYDDAHIPATIYVGQVEGHVIGMLALYIHDRGTAYIQYAGFRKAWQGKPMTFWWLKAVLTELHQTYQHLLAEIRADNPLALRFALKAGFAITGTRLDPSGQLLVHLLHEGHHGRIA